MRPDIHFRPWNIRTETPTTNARRVYVAHEGSYAGMTASALLDPEVETAPERVASAQVWEIPTTPTASLQSRAASSLGAQFVSGPWGWLPLLSVSTAIGVALQALADWAGRTGLAWANLPFWLGLGVIFAPVALRLLAGIRATRRERVGVLIIAGLGLYFIRLLQYPTSFALNDEFQHWRTALDIVTSHHLGSSNPILPVSPSFPGLEIVTTALSSLGGIPLFPAGMVIIGLARVTLVLALMWLFESISESSRLASIGALLYLMNPSILFDDGQYGYEALALPLAVLALIMVTRAIQSRGRVRIPFVAIGILLFYATVITHHSTALLFAALLCCILFGLLIRANRRMWATVGILVALALVAAAVWLVFSGNRTFTYLAWYPSQTLSQLLNFIRGGGQGRKLFANWGQPIPEWEQVISFVSVGVFLIGLPFGWWQIWRRYRLNATACVLALAALAYPVSLALRLVPAGVDGATRLMAWSFISVSFVLATAMTRFLAARSHYALYSTPSQSVLVRQTVSARRSHSLTNLLWRLSAYAAVCLVCAAFLGSMVIGAGQAWHQTPGPYLVGGGARAVSTEGIDAATWMSIYVGHNHNVITDGENQLLMATYGDQNPVTDQSGHYEPAWIIAASTFDGPQRQLAQKLGIQYIEVDLRLSTALPAGGLYFDEGEPGAFQHTTPIPAAALEKFDGAVGLDRIYDNGAIAIYQIGAAS